MYLISGENERQASREVAIGCLKLFMLGRMRQESNEVLWGNS